MEEGWGWGGVTVSSSILASRQPQRVTVGRKTWGGGGGVSDFNMLSTADTHGAITDKLIEAKETAIVDVLTSGAYFK